MPSHLTNFWYPRYEREISTLERHQGYGALMRTLNPGGSRSVESATIGGSIWLKNTKVRPTALSAKRSGPSKDM
jgi:hypothetical protein